MSLWLSELWRNPSHFSGIAVIKGPTMRVWRPLGVNKHTNMLLWLAESRNEPSNIELWLLISSNKPYKMSLWLSEMWKNRHILGVLLR